MGKEEGRWGREAETTASEYSEKIGKEREREERGRLGKKIEGER